MIHLILSLAVFAISETEIKNLKQQYDYQPTAACSQGGYFNTCFSVDEKTCQEQSKDAIKSCFNLKKPEMVSLHTVTAQTWNEKIDECVTKELSLKWKDQFKRKPACLEYKKGAR